MNFINFVVGLYAYAATSVMYDQLTVPIYYKYVYTIIASYNENNACIALPKIYVGLSQKTMIYPVVLKHPHSQFCNDKCSSAYVCSYKVCLTKI